MLIDLSLLIKKVSSCLSVCFDLIKYPEYECKSCTNLSVLIFKTQLTKLVDIP